MTYNICLWIVCALIVFALIGCTAAHNTAVVAVAAMVAVCEKNPIKAFDILGEYKWE